MINPFNIFNRNPHTPTSPAIKPESTFDAILEIRLAELHRHISELKGRINTLFFFVLIAAMLQFVFGIAQISPLGNNAIPSDPTSGKSPLPS